jgi:hypothetical protein
MECRALSVATDVVRWHQETSVYSQTARYHHQNAQNDNVSAHVCTPPLFDECTYAILAALSFATSTTVMATSSSATAAETPDASAMQRRVVDEFDIDTPSPPHNHHVRGGDLHLLLLQANKPYRLDSLTQAAITLYRSQQVCSCSCPHSH